MISLHSHRSKAPRGRLLLATLAAALLLPPMQADLAGQEVTLRYGFTEGMELRYELVQSSTTQVPGMGPLTQEQRQTLKIEVLDVDGEGNAKIRQSVERIQLEMATPMGPQSWDSADSAAPPSPEFAGLAALIGPGPIVTVRRDGSLADAGDMDEWLRSMVEESDPEMQAMLEQLMSPETIEGMIAQSFQPLGPAAISIGDSWDHTVEVPLPFGRMVSTTVYTLDEVASVEGRRVARLALSGRVGELIPEEGDPMAAMIQLEGGDISGDAEFDVDRGVFLSTRIETDMNMAAMGQSIVVTSRVELRLLP